MSFQHILASLPYEPPFLFVDGLSRLDDDGAEGYFTFQPKMDFYKGHFKNNPVTPGVLLTECCAQIGLVCLGLHLLGKENVAIAKVGIGFSSSEMEFLKPVFPGEKVRVTSKKIYFRFRKLKCEVKMYDANGDLVCKGILAGMLTNNKDE
ncbi:hydroxymyristoyl-ACP dehydratase [Maribacter sp. 4U21]|uniref:3-hydroxyacyl-ACP dehydratase FabZ family protein n=1 Tax=Maribacter sp. 4U21 TaxID=1889779 RepID=UPI000C1481DD|nr:FabA/FabZ family ACP-dehydratase [Maribacter sp. 4U21]PIB23760.1 hydroxymyristoyl-ACP dehydratase [Maribacter sp. 4U21]